MKFILFYIMLFLTLLANAQMLNNLDYAASMVISSYFPGNIGNKLESKGFTLSGSNYTDDDHIVANYVLKKDDEFYYNVFIIKQGVIKSITLTFNDRSKNIEYEKILLDIKEFMTKKNDIQKDGNNYQVYIDNSGFYFAYTSFYSTGHKQNLYSIEIMNKDAFNLFIK